MSKSTLVPSDPVHAGAEPGDRDRHGRPPSQDIREWSAATVDALRRSVLRFFAEERRDLPWRADRDPYRVLVSEVMLQQTRAETVIPYFERWMERFPTVGHLAEAEPEEVLRAWQGLGYYARARNLRGAVREVERHYHGRIPEDPDELRTLPGVGPYTAGAVASIAYGVATPAVDGNVRRVLSRLTDSPGPSDATLRGWAGILVDPDDPGGFNQGLMEIGARVCTPRGPSCSSCPLGAFCHARRAGTQESRPAPVARGQAPTVVEAVAALVRGEGAERSVALRRRPDRGLLGGMWELPGAPVPEAETPEGTARRLARSLVGADLPKVARLDSVRHAFTHRRMRYEPFIFAASDASPQFADSLRDRLRWVSEDEKEALPIPAAQLKILAQIFLGAKGAA